MLELGVKLGDSEHTLIPSDKEELGRAAFLTGGRLNCNIFFVFHRILCLALE